MRVEYICQHIVKCIHTSVRCYDSDGIKTEEFGEIEGQDNLFVCDPDFERKLLAQASNEYPYLYFEELVVGYAVIIGERKQQYLVGPVCVDMYPQEAAEKIKKNHGIQSQYRISRCRIESFCEEILLLHNFENNMEMTYLQLMEHNFLDDYMLHSVRKELSDVYFEYQENEKVHNPYDREQREVDSIRQGDVERLRRSLDEVFAGEYGTLSKNPLRASKNLAICGIIIASRAAISGGLLPEIVFSICDSYILKIDEASYIGQPEALTRQAKFHYAELVAQQKEKADKNMLVERCKSIIYKNMHGKIKVKEIAKQLYVNPDYLSHLFHQEEGIGIHAYIEREKIRLAENMLIYSNYTYEEIGYYLGFSSQSHFGKVFKKWKDLTPKRFRDQHSIENFISDR